MQRKSRLTVLAAAAASAASAILAGQAFASSDDSYSTTTGNRVVDISANQSRLQQNGFTLNLTGGKFGRMILGSGAASSGDDITPHANVSATWIGGSGTWTDATNWSTNPSVPDGTSAVATFGPLSGGPQAIIPGTITLSQLNLTDPANPIITGADTSPSGGTLALAGLATINSNANWSDPVNVIYSGINSIGAGTGTNGSGPLAVTISGTAGLTKTGDSPLQLNNANTYTGNTTITGGGRISMAAGDATLGSGGTISLDNGTLAVYTVNWSTSRNINVTANGGQLWWVGSNRAIAYSGNISGSGTLTLQGGFGAGSQSIASFTTAQSHTGTLVMGGGTINLTGAGAFANSSAIINDGTIVLRYAGSTVNKLGDTAPITMTGSNFTIATTTGSIAEQLGNITATGSSQYILFRPNTGGSTGQGSLGLGNITRQNGATFQFRGRNLGMTPGTGVTNVYFANGASEVVNGLIPWAIVNNGEQGQGAGIAAQPTENEHNLLATYNATTGVTPITTYLNSFAGSTSADNVQLLADSSTVSFGISGVNNANALVITARTDAGVARINDTPFTINGSGTIALRSGVILNASAGSFASGGTPANSLPGNIIAAGVNIDAGTNTIMIHAPAALSINGTLWGSGGLNKDSGRTLFMNGANHYTGQTILSGFNRWTGNVAADGVTPGPYGLDTSPILLTGSNVTPTGGGAGGAILALDEQQVGSSTFARALDVQNGFVLIRNFSNDLTSGTVSFTGNVAVATGSTIAFQSLAPTDPANPLPDDPNNNRFVVSGNVSGGGRLETTVGLDTAGTTAGNNGPLILTLSGNNTYSGGTDLEGFIKVNTNTPFGTGSVTFTGSDLNAGFIEAVGSARTITNDLRIIGTMGTNGSLPVTFSGNITSNGALLDIQNSATTTFSGNLVSGDTFKQGAGTLVLSGANSTTGLINVGNGLTPGGTVIVRNNLALGTPDGLTGVNAGDNTLALDPGTNIAGAELLILRGDGVGGLGGLRSLGGTTNWGGSVLIQDQNDDTVIVSQRGSIGVDSGTLNIVGGIGTTANGEGTLAATNGFRKVGAGTLVVGSDIYVNNSGTATFNGSVVVEGGIDVQQGTLVMRSKAGAATLNNSNTVAIAGTLAFAGGNVSPTSRLDLTTNALVVDGTQTPLADVKSLIVAGRSGGTWTGNGLTSSAAASGPLAGKTALGYGQASTAGISTFLGVTTDPTDVLVRFTYLGDTNLDGKVDIVDLGKLASKWQQTGAWLDGDFNYDGIINIVDLGSLAGNWQAGVSSPLGETFEEALQAVGLGNVQVPEPASLGLLAVAGAGMLARRRRRSN